MTTSAAAKRPDVDWERVEAKYAEEILGAAERDVVWSFLIEHRGGFMDERLPMSKEDTIVTEMAFRYGRADIVIFHIDGTATVIEAKDGAKGYNHVVGGIGQAGLYAAQLAATKGAIRKVRRALLWSSTGDIFLDALIEEVCEAAGVIPLPHASAKRIRAAHFYVLELLSQAKQGAHDASTQEG